MDTRCRSPPERFEPPLADARVPAARKASGDLVHVCKLRRVDDLIAGEDGVADPDVIQDRVVEQVHVLEHRGYGVFDHRSAEPWNGYASDRHRSDLGVVEAGDELRNRCLARSGGTDDRRQVSGRGGETQSAEHRWAAIAEGDVAELDAPVGGNGRGGRLGQRLDAVQRVELV